MALPHLLDGVVIFEKAYVYDDIICNVTDFEITPLNFCSFST